MFIAFFVGLKIPVAAGYRVPTSVLIIKIFTYFSGLETKPLAHLLILIFCPRGVQMCVLKFVWGTIGFDHLIGLRLVIVD